MKTAFIFSPEAAYGTMALCVNRHDDLIFAVSELFVLRSEAPRCLQRTRHRVTCDQQFFVGSCQTRAFPGSLSPHQNRKRLAIAVKKCDVFSPSC